MPKGLLILLLSIVPAFGLAQQPVSNVSKYKTAKEKLKALSHVCDSLNAIEAYDKTLETARYALKMTPANDYYNLSLFNYYIGAYYQGINGDTSILYLEKSLAYGRKANKPKRIINALERLLYMYSATDGYGKQRDKTATEVLHIVDTTRSDGIKKTMYNALTKYYEMLGSRERQMNTMLSALEIYKKELSQKTFDGADSANLGVSYINIGSLYTELKQPKKALEYLTPSRKFIEQYKVAILHYYKNTADAYLQLSQPNTAKVYYDSLTSLTKQEFGAPTDRNNNWDIRMLSDLSFADYYLANKKIDNALSYMKIAQTLIGTSVTDTLDITVFNYKMGKTLVAAKDYAGALVYLKNAEKIGKDMGLGQYADVLRELAQCYSGTGQWQKAALYYQKYLPIRDSLYTEDIQKSMDEAEAKFQNKEKQQQIKSQQKDLNFAQKQRIWLIAGLSLTGLIALLLIIFYRNKKKTADVLDRANKQLSQLNTELEEANRTKAKLFGIIGHDFRSPVKQVYQFLKLQKLNVHTEQEKAERAAKIEAATESLLETMEDLLLWSKTQMNELKPHIESIELLPALNPVEQLLQLNMEAKNIQFRNTIGPESTVTADYNFLQTIYRNLLQNAIKASPQDGSIVVNLSVQNGSSILSIQNNGAAFSQQDFEKLVHSRQTAHALNGLGLQLVQELSGKMKAEVRFAPIINGTVSELIFAPEP